ncbi:hypothetical protein BDP55DRAFT_713119 [Colletotrichum godetiae]|uniref:Uncharacterized protein n=1 Tax=Colletotrichum godetiae TaxID=1209918 RepID=A0AAJ0AR37_9PEZI|nr:uncharacterized protein BDP55DRAFT_713119 [Colletotrichum godetiae]KAK1688821.1 hypothetical protein BDP55DRAFT_713119 [Colletotrichum godetiae]
MEALAILALVAAAVAAAAAATTGTNAAFRQRYAAVDMSPAVEGAGLVPRFFIDAPRLAVRDGENEEKERYNLSPKSIKLNGNPPTGVDIGHPETCCGNTNYCYVKPDNTPWCCPLGSNCDSNCAATAYQCPTTITVTVTVSQTRSASSSAALLTTSITTSSACCGRTCPSPSAFRCESQFGGGCCSYGQTCVSNRGCVSTLSAPTSSATGGLKPADPRCTATTQHACDDGRDGCCDNLMHCTIVGGTAGCAAGNPTATGDVGYTTVPDGGAGGGGLSAGAKAGIGVGVAVVGCALAGVLAWFCFSRRRRGRGTVTGTATMSERSGGGGRSRVAGGGGGAGVSGVGSERPSRGVRALSDVTSGSRPNGPSRGATQDYFGPDAVAGPYTETEETGMSAVDGSGAGAGAGAGTGMAGTPGRGRGVPLQAHSPNDVVAPVEIGDSGGKRGYGYGYGHSVTSVPEGEHEGPRELQTPVSEEETTQGRYELYGSEMASPVSGAPPSSIVPTPSMMTPRSIASVSMFDRSPGPAPSERERER